MHKQNPASRTDPLFIVYDSRLNEMVDLVKSAGYETKAFADSAESRFMTFPEERRTEIIAAVEGSLKIFASAIAGGVSPKDNRQMAWWALRELGYRPLSDAFSMVKDDNVIEIYDQNHKQVFRTLNFFPCLSYSLDEINTYEWWELYNRDEAVTQVMIATVGELMSRPPATFVQPFDVHWVQEKFSERKNWARIKSNILTPLLRNSGGPVVGYLNAFELLDLRKTDEDV